ncbi:hypothetical protein MC885_017365, partial [Smutsia gigantea]
MRPPSKDGSYVNLYDSCVDDTWNPKIFVVFDANQIYPDKETSLPNKKYEKYLMKKILILKALPPGGLSPAAPPRVTLELHFARPSPSRPPPKKSTHGKTPTGLPICAARPVSSACGPGPGGSCEPLSPGPGEVRQPFGRPSWVHLLHPLPPFPGSPSGGARRLPTPGRAQQAQHPRRPPPGPTGHALPAEPLARPPPHSAAPRPQAEVGVPEPRSRPAAPRGHVPSSSQSAVAFVLEVGPALDQPPKTYDSPGQRLQVRVDRRPAPAAGELRRGEWAPEAQRQRRGDPRPGGE